MLPPTICSSSLSSSSPSTLPKLLSELSKVFVMPHFLKDVTIISAGISFHASIIHQHIKSFAGFFKFPVLVYLCSPVAIHVLHFSRIQSLNGLLILMSNGCTLDVRRPGMTPRTGLVSRHLSST